MSHCCKPGTVARALRQLTACAAEASYRAVPCICPVIHQWFGCTDGDFRRRKSYQSLGTDPVAMVMGSTGNDVSTRGGGYISMYGIRGVIYTAQSRSRFEIALRCKPRWL